MNVIGGPPASPFAADGESVTPTCGSTTVTDVEPLVEPPWTANTTELFSPCPRRVARRRRVTTAVYVTTIVWVWVVSRLELVIVPKSSVTDPPPAPTVAADSTPANPPACDVPSAGDAVMESRLTTASPAGRVSVRVAVLVTPSGTVTVT